MKRFLLASTLTLTAMLAANQPGLADCRYQGNFSWSHSYEHTGSCRTFYYHSQSNPLPPVCNTYCASSGPACAAAPYPVPVAAPAPAVAAPAPAVTALPAPAAPGASGYTAPAPTPSDSRTSWMNYANGTQAVGYSTAAPGYTGGYNYGGASYASPTPGYAGYGQGPSFQAPSYWYDH